MKTIASKIYSLGMRDAVKAFWMFLFSTIVSILGDAVMQAVNSGTYSLDAIHWREVVAAITVAVVGYLKMKFLSNSKGEILSKEDAKP